MKRLLSVILTVLTSLSCFSGCKKAVSEHGGTTAPIQETVPPANPDGLSLEEDGIVYESLAQKAVVKTALAYLARGTRIQYDDSRICIREAAGSTGILYRWQSGVRTSPEEYTSQSIGYTNCAAFTSDVYLSALELNIGNTTTSLSNISDARQIYKYFPTGSETDQEKSTIKQEFLSNLKMGDIIVIRYNGELAGNGHAMLYVGQKALENADGYRDVSIEGADDTNAPSNTDYVYDIIHSTGKSYNYDQETEAYEEHGTVQMMSANSLFDSATRRYIFGKLESIAIIRPLKNFNGDVPERTQNRLLNMDNIVAEKLSSHTIGMTASPGDTITYTFSITNKNTTDVTLQVKDVVPENTTFGASDNCTVNGKNLSWVVTVPAGQTTAVSYTVKVNTDAQARQIIESTEGSVGGIAVNCPQVYVGTTLTEAQQQALLSAIEKYADSQLRGMALANALYKDVLGGKDLLPDDYATVLDGIFYTVDECFFINEEEGTYRDALVPGLFGGRYVHQRKLSTKIKDQYQLHENNRTRLPQPEHLIAGDILIAAQDADATIQKLYLFTGEQMLDLNSGETLSYLDVKECLNPILSYNRFAIIRPSLLLDETI